MILTDEDIESCSNFSHNRYRFARAIESAVLKKLAEQDVEPVGYQIQGGKMNLRLIQPWEYNLSPEYEKVRVLCEPLFTESQLIAAQQRTAEACAKVCAKRSDVLREPACLGDATAIRNGEWREYL